MKPFFIFLILISYFTFYGISQVSKIFIEPTIHIGRIIRHTTPFPEIKNNTVSLEINFTKSPGGNKLWHRLYPHLSTFGVAVIYSNFGDASVLGSAVGILPNLTFSKGKKNISFYYSFGAGLAYLSKPYDILENPSNNVIGSHFNNISFLNVGFECNLTSKFLLKPSVSLIHYSNGRVKLPDLGYNIPSVSLAGKFFLAEKNRQARMDTMLPVNKKIHGGMELGCGMNQFGNSRGPVYSIYLGKIFLSKNFTHKNKISTGLEYVFDTGIYSSIILAENFSGEEKWRASRLIYFLAHEFVVGHLSFLAQGGFFLSKPFNTGTKFPTKLGVQYYFFTPYFRNHHHIYSGIYLAAHSFEADYVAVAVGYVF